MWKDRTLEADIEYAAEMVREGLATPTQAAHACGVSLPALQTRLTSLSKPAVDLSGSVSPGSHRSVDADSGVHAPHRPDPQPSETTDYFAFYREANLWVWKRVDDRGRTVSACADGFRYYLDCVADARPHGFTGRPLFIFAATDVASQSSSPR
jgi:hypothetical protein